MIIFLLYTFGSLNFYKDKLSGAWILFWTDFSFISDINSYFYNYSMHSFDFSIETYILPINLPIDF